MRRVQAVALRAWRFTYRHIYTQPNIERFVSRYYSDESFEKYTFPGIRRGRSWFYVAVDDSQVVGYSHLGKHKEEWELLRIYLLPEYIGKGIGKRLLRLGERFLKRKRASSYFVYVHAKNKIGKKFYLRNGFVRAKQRDHGPSSQCLEKMLIV